MCHNVITISVVKNEVAGDVFADIIFHTSCYICIIYVYICMCMCVCYNIMCKL